ncbi:hypothetical protein [Kingella oralis]|nr:hypothetical protein [Kingella oralis]
MLSLPQRQPETFGTSLTCLRLSLPPRHKMVFQAALIPQRQPETPL